MSSTPKVYIFWDNSNIFISAKNLADTMDGLNLGHSLRIHFKNIFKLACASRTIAGGLICGSIPPEHKEMWDAFKKETNELPMQLQERGAQSGTEQGVDQAIQVVMLRALADEKEPQIAVLLTGDGKGYEVGTGFHADLERMKNNGWGIEVIAWDISCKKTLKDWAEKNGSYIKLEDYYKSVTFIKNGRKEIALNLTKRPRSQPTIKEIEETDDRIKMRRRKKAQERSQRNTKKDNKKKR